MKQEQRRYVSQELILAEAIKEFGKYGYGDASVNRICEAGQISKGRLFHYYKDKDELFLTCVQACYDHLQQVQEFFRAERLNKLSTGIFACGSSIFKIIHMRR